MHSPEAGAGAICHALLPSGSLEDGFRYVDSTVHYIFEKLCVITGKTGGFEAKLFGGSDMLLLSQDKGGALSIGQQNIQAAHKALEKLGLTLTASDTSGQSGRKIFFNTRTGIVLMRRVKKTIW
jgi:chemotaxis protein CheD